jgi:hypothetical protein
MAIKHILAGQRVFEGFGQAKQTRFELGFIAERAACLRAGHQPHLAQLIYNSFQQNDIAQEQLLRKLVTGPVKIRVLV